MGLKSEYGRRLAVAGPAEGGRGGDSRAAEAGGDRAESAVAGTTG